MGQQQLLLIVLGVIIVGIAVVVGINLFNSSSKDAGRDQVVSNLTNLASKAQQYYKKPTSLGGGQNDFNGFTLAATDTGSSVGSFSVATGVPSGAAYVAGSTTGISAASQTIYLTGCGKDKGNDDTNPVKAYTVVTPTTITTHVLN
ncbi:MAG: hypothetical protein HF309_18935 [Ignavibacteria bacterium]|jgi:type II secretory pathway pseudopilin PulG|nr:hypothetical protein [Ignavibacteria bacterium]MCU7501356.1 hypothetical protein [Ignavibacteria bacterium]MCU7522381.1 hypothetical protein [Ignavibacteria bacterium]MCU7526653.1 hypothetical protein [Ignavibacteria bacterium]HEX2960189.1 hypothetical protein [Ignavibacteriales bacterium]